MNRASPLLIALFPLIGYLIGSLFGVARDVNDIHQVIVEDKVCEVRVAR